MDEISNLIKKLKRPYPQYRVEISTCLAATLHAINGISWSITLSDWQYFERSGAIVVIIGILLAWRDVTGNIEWFKIHTKLKINSEIIELQKNTSGIVNGAIQAGKQKTLNELKAEVQKLLDALKSRIRTIEATVLIIGTLIWAYGSIIGKSIHNFA